jgi:hypothetical protein
MGKGLNSPFGIFSLLKIISSCFKNQVENKGIFSRVQVNLGIEKEKLKSHLS